MIDLAHQYLLYIKDIQLNILSAVHGPTAIECLRLGSGGTSNFSSTESPISPVVRMMMLMRMEMTMMMMTGCPQKNALSECCWSHSALAQSQVAGTPCGWKLFFWSFLTKTKPDQPFPSHFHDRI